MTDDQLKLYQDCQKYLDCLKMQGTVRTDHSSNFMRVAYRRHGKNKFDHAVDEHFKKLSEKPGFTAADIYQFMGMSREELQLPPEPKVWVES